MSHASAGSRTRIYCLEGNNADRYTTDANTKVPELLIYLRVHCFVCNYQKQSALRQNNG